MSVWLAFGVGFMVGGLLGILVMCLLAMAKD